MEIDRMATRSSYQQRRVHILPDDVLIDILARVPYRSLCRFKSVSRPWLALCSDPGLRKRSPQTLSGFFCSSRNAGDGFHLFNLSGKGRPLVDPSLPFLRGYERIDLVQCCNGLLLCRCLKHCRRPDELRRYVVCNPLTEKCAVLPYIQVRRTYQTIHLGFEPAVSSHFTVFMFLLNYPITEAGIYSSETGEWTERRSDRWGANIVSIGRYESATVFFNGILHMTTLGSSVLTVDKEGKTWRNIPMPRTTAPGSRSIEHSQGRLYAMHINRSMDSQLSVWVLEDYDSERWTLKHTISLVELFRRRDEFYYVYVLAIHPERDLIFLSWWNVSVMERNLMAYDMEIRKGHVIGSLEEDFLPPYEPYIPSFAGLLSDGH